MQNNIEKASILRPALEFYSALAFLSAALILLFFPKIFSEPFLLRNNLILTFSCLSAWRLYQVFNSNIFLKHAGYKKSLYISSKKLLKDESRVLVGKGFLWNAKHSQLLKSMRDYGYDNIPIHTVVKHNKNIYIEQKERNGHVLVLGTTRVGKTRLAELLITQDIYHGRTVIVIDPKGDKQLLAQMQAAAKSCNRDEGFYKFLLDKPEQSCFYNPIANFSRVTEVAQRLTSNLPDQGNSAAFKAFSWQFINTIAGALHALGLIPSYRLLEYYLQNLDFLLERYIEEGIAHGDPESILCLRRGKRQRRQWLNLLTEYIHSQDTIALALLDACRYDVDHYRKLTASLYPLLKKLTSGDIADLLSPVCHGNGKQPPTINWRQVIKERAIVYVSLDALSDREVALAVGGAMFSDLTATAGLIYKSGVNSKLNDITDVCIHSDEFNESIGDEFIPLLNKAGGAGFQVTAYTQTLADIEARVVSKAKAAQIIGNFNTLIMLRVKDPATAELLTKQLQDVSISQLSYSLGTADSHSGSAKVSYNATYAERIQTQQMPLLTTHDLISLPKGEAFCLQASGHLHKICIPLLSTKGV